MISRRLFKFSIISRFSIIILQVIFNLIIPDHDADAFRLPYIAEEGSGNAILSFFLNGFSHWDAQYFLHIALYGYTHENTLAFFPLFPLSLRQTSNVLSYITLSILSDLNRALLSGVILNTALFSLTTLCLYKLTYSVFHSETIAYCSALLFCINPASIFFTTLYSESLFSFFTFSGLWALERGNFIIALVMLSLSCGVRSNGIISAGFLVYYLLRRCIHFKTTSFMSSRAAVMFLSNVLKIMVCLILFSIPFIAYQTYCYLLYCTDYLFEPEVPDVVLDYVTKNDLKIPSEPSKWCFWRIPFSYSYVQARYWDVGFLQYFTIKQVPNFLLASPVLLLVIFSCLRYFLKNRREIWHFNFLHGQFEDPTDIYRSMKCFPYFLHLLILVLLSTFCIHIQVITRMLCSSSPIIYWVAAMIILPTNERARFKFSKEHLHEPGISGDLQFMKKLFLKSSILGKVIFCYFISYSVIGTLLHVNFFPWT